MIADILHKIAEDEVIGKEPHHYSARPSLAGPERCIRQLVYWGLEYKRKPLPGRALHIFNDSNFHEELTADWLRKTAYKLHSEQMEVQITDTMKGHIDGILTDLTGKDILWEHKAINHFTFGMYEKGKKFPLDYITQTCLYLKGLQQIQPELTDALLLIKNKNTSQFLEYYLNYGSDTVSILYMMNSTDNEKVKVNFNWVAITQDSFKKFNEINSYIVSKTIPLRQYEQTDWQCDYCPYGEICWKGWEEEIEQMESDKVLDEEIETMAHYYLELSMHEKEAKTEKEILKKKIKTRMKEKNIRSGKAGKYTFILSVRNMAEQIRKAYSFEVLTIRLKKEEKNAKG
ncbi:hypothetical protein KAU34_04695, partial [candidate division WOR-3 bacterium]|nr:hypothetical protein [candidate division WOR-3 bacterium]